MFKFRVKDVDEPIFVASSAALLVIEIIPHRPHRRCSHKTNIMYALRNKVQLIGNLGGKPEVKTTETGKKMARFSVATNEAYRNARGEKVIETQWHSLVAWGKVAEIIEKYLSKGSEVAVEGKLVNRSYTDRNGVKKHITEVQVSEVLMLDKKK